MRYDLNQTLRNHRGDEILETTKEVVDGAEVTETKAITLGVALERACVAGSKPNATAEDKYKQYKLAQKVSQESAELSSDEVERLKHLASSIYSPIAFGAVWSALENPVTVQ